MIDVRNVHKSYRSGSRRVEALARDQLPDRSGPVRVHRRAERVGQEHAALPARCARPPDVGRDPRRRAGPRADVRGRAERLSPRPDRLHLPVVQPDQQPDGGRERAGPVPAAGRDGRAAAAGRRPADRGRPGRTASTTALISSPAASSSGWRSPGRWSRSRSSSWPTSRPASSTPRPATRSTRSSAGSRTASSTTLVVVTHDRRFITPDDLVLEIQDGQLASGDEAETVDYSEALTRR